MARTVSELGLFVIAAFVVLALLRVPVFIALLAPSSLYVFITGRPVLFPSIRMVRTLDSFTLLAIPLFIYVGSLMNHGEITEKIFDFADSVVGHVTGGLAQVNIVTSLIFSGLSGSALADIGGVGRVLIESMEDAGYESDYAAALTSASATIGPIFPPSVPLILFGIIAEVSVLRLLLAGAVPALVATVSLMVGTAFLARRRGFPGGGGRAALGVMLQAFLVAMPAVLAPALLIYGMLGGYFSPTEAAGVTVLYILVINAAVYRIFNLNYIWEAAKETAETSGTVVIILAGAALFSFVMSVEQIDTLFANALFSVSENRVVVLLLVNAVLLFIGLFLDPIAALVMMTPIVFPTLVEVGVNPIHIGVIMVFNLMLGLLTPPLGLSVYLSSDIADTSVASVFDEVRPYWLFLAGALLVITYFPPLSLAILDFV